jgi:hypothetical protein
MARNAPRVQCHTRHLAPALPQRTRAHPPVGVWVFVYVGARVCVSKWCQLVRDKVVANESVCVKVVHCHPEPLPISVRLGDWATE